MAKKSGVSASRVKKTVKAVNKVSRSKAGLIFLAIVLVLAVGTLLALYCTGNLKLPGFIPNPNESKDSQTETVHEVVAYDSEDLIITFLELGNWFTGDCTFIKAGDTDILIDAGSRLNSVPSITEVINKYCTDGKLEYVIVTHAHQDHIAGFAPGSESSKGIFDYYECGLIIDYAQTNSTAKVKDNYEKARDKEVESGATHMTAAQVRERGHYVFDLSEGITMTILDSKFYYDHSSNENNYSVCCLINQGGDRNFLFTGDLEEDGEKYLVERNSLPKVNLFKGGHHGSYTASSETLLEVIQPEIVCICCCAFSNEYTDVEANMFPAQSTIDRIANYTDRVYVTTVSTDNSTKAFESLNGTITVTSKKGEEITVSCSGLNVPLKDTPWFKEKREMPDKWKTAA